MVSRTSPICSGADRACWAVALGGGDIKVAGRLGGAMPVLLMALARGGAVVPLGIRLGGHWRPGVCLGGGAKVFSGIAPMIVGARDSVFVARNTVILKRYAAGVSGPLPWLRTQRFPEM